MASSYRKRMKRQGRKDLQKQQKYQSENKDNKGRYPDIFKKSKIPDGIEKFKADVGEHIIDIIPWEAGKDHPTADKGEFVYVLDIMVHQQMGNMKAPYVCPYENFGDPCPICEYMKANHLSKKAWAWLRPKRRVVYLIWVHDDREQEKKGLQIFEASHYLMENHLDELAKLPHGGGATAFHDIEDGKSIMWTRKGKNRETKYLGHKFVDRANSIPDKICESTFPLDSVIKMRPKYDKMQAALDEMMPMIAKMKDDDSDSDSDSDRDKKKKKKSKDKKKDKKSKGKSSSKKSKDKKKKKKSKTGDDVPF